MTKEMKKRWTFAGLTLEQAIEKAEKAMGGLRDEMCVKVVSEEKKRLLGMEGAEPDKIVVTRKEANKL
jgi:predicted RNA-binding protein Jag